MPLFQSETLNLNKLKMTAKCKEPTYDGKPLPLLRLLLLAASLYERMKATKWFHEESVLL